MIFLQNLVFSNLHNIYTCCIETTNLLYKDHTVSVWHYHNSENPNHPSFIRGLPSGYVTLLVSIAGLLLLRDDKDFQSWDSGTQTLCGPSTADIQSLCGEYTGCADWRLPDFVGKS